MIYNTTRGRKETGACFCGEFGEDGKTVWVIPDVLTEDTAFEEIWEAVAVVDYLICGLVIVYPKLKQVMFWMI